MTYQYLPETSDSFIGRSAEIAMLHQAIGGGGLHALVGPGGVGKTRLAIEAARGYSGGSSKTVGFVSCADARNIDGVVAAFADSLSPLLSANDCESWFEALGEWLTRHGFALLIIDNVEHLRADVCNIINWIRRSSGLTILATSREPLGHADERLHTVVPLVGDGDGARLFQARAGSGLLPPDSQPQVAALVEALDGLPLPIEMAAARLEILTLDQISQLAAAPLELARNPSAPVAHRQSALVTTFDWSWDLLTSVERTVLVQSAVFAHEISADCARIVISAPDSDVVEILDSLVSKSMLQRRVNADNEPRWWLLVTVRAFAAQRKDAAVDAAKARHRAFFVPPSESKAAGHVYGEFYRDVLQIIESALLAEPTRANIDMAASGVRLIRLPLASQFPNLFYLDLLNRVIEFSENVDHTEKTLWAWHDRTAQFNLMCRYDDGTEDAHRLAAVAHTMGHDSVEAHSLRNVAVMAMNRARFDVVPAFLDRAIAAARRGEVPDFVGYAHAIAAGALYATSEQDGPRAIERFKMAIDELVDSDPRRCAWVHVHLGGVLMEAGQLTEAVHHLDRSEALYETHGGQHREHVQVSHYRATVLHLQGDLTQALAGYEQAIGFARQHEDDRLELPLLYHRAQVCAELGNYSAVAAQADEIVALLRRQANAGYLHSYRGVAASAPALAGLRASREFVEPGDVESDLVELLLDLYQCAMDCGAADVFAPRIAALKDRNWDRSWRVLRGRTVKVAVERAKQARNTWCFQRSGQWCRPPGKAIIELASRRILSELLAALVAEPLEVDEASRMLWPNQTLTYESARNRVYNAVSTLRSMGIPILSENQVYRLDPTLRFFVMRANEDSAPG